MRFLGSSAAHEVWACSVAFARGFELGVLEAGVAATAAAFFTCRCRGPYAVGAGRLAGCVGNAWESGMRSHLHKGTKEHMSLHRTFYSAEHSFVTVKHSELVLGAGDMQLHARIPEDMSFGCLGLVWQQQQWCLLLR